MAQEPIDDFVIEDPSIPSPEEIMDSGNGDVANQAPLGHPNAAILEGFFEDINYSPTDKRDPFLPYLTMTKIKVVNATPDSPLEPLQQFALDQLKIIGIIWDVGKPKALVSDPAGKSYIVTENTKVGRDFGYVAAIREGEVIVVEQVQDGQGNKSYQTKILKLSQK